MLLMLLLLLWLLLLLRLLRRLLLFLLLLQQRCLLLLLPFPITQRLSLTPIIPLHLPLPPPLHIFIAQGNCWRRSAAAADDDV